MGNGDSHTESTLEVVGIYLFAMMLEVIGLCESRRLCEVAAA